jgi:hypothetical protein
MPQIEVRTRTYVPKNTKTKKRGRGEWQDAELLLEIILTPRGSGNRKFAVGLAKAAKASPQLAPHIRRVKAGSSKVWIYLTPSFGLMKTIALWQSGVAQANEDVPGQLPLFGSASIA